jgi:NAD(P)-dependent dehydrogenase (short-subunit alcohol dehydrogenase family)
LKKGDIVVATCRGGIDRLSGLRDAGAIPLELDITSDATILDKFVKDVLDLPAVKAAGGVDVLINNAGYVLQGTLEETS